MRSDPELAEGLLEYLAWREFERMEGGAMLTVFERIPDLFVQHYDSSFQVWAREFRKRGPKCAIPFDRAPGAVPILDAEGRPVWKGAWLVAEVDRSLPQTPRVVIRPEDAASEEAIERHTREMARHWVS